MSGYGGSLREQVILRVFWQSLTGVCYLVVNHLFLQLSKHLSTVDFDKPASSRLLLTCFSNLLHLHKPQLPNSNVALRSPGLLCVE